MNADWIMLATNEVEGESSRPIGLMVPRRELAIRDVWFFSGLKGTGSNTVSVDEVFVPSCREWELPKPRAVTDPLPALRSDPCDAEDCPLANVSPLRLFDVLLPAIALGAGDAAISLFLEKMKSRVVAFGMGRQIEHPEAWARFAEAWRLARLADLQWKHSVSLLAEVVDSGYAATLLVAAELRLSGPSVCRLVRDAVMQVMDGAGSSVHLLSDPLQRIQRDVDVVKSHNYLHWDGASTQVGYALLGLEQPSWMLLA
jgi:GTP cyclohydrolase II